MRIYLEHDAKMLGTMLGVNPPGCDGVITRLGDPLDILGSTIRSNPLGNSWLFDADAPGAHIVSWSGTLAEEMFDSHPMTWLRPGHEALAGFCDDVQAQLQAHERTLCFQPHARHVLSDPQSCLHFLKERADQPFSIALSPASMLEAPMLAEAADHLARAFEAIGPRCAMVILHDLRVVDAQDGAESLEAVPLGEGVLPREHMLELIAEHVPEQTPLVLQPQRLDDQLAWLSVEGATTK